LLALSSHPVQYQAPLFRKLAGHPEVDLMVYYCSDFGVTENVDSGFGVSIKWDRPLLEGYAYRFLKNYAPSSSPSRFWGLINPGINRALLKERYDAIFIHGYALATNWLAFIGALISKTPVLFRGETLLRPEQAGFKKIIKDTVLKASFRKMKAFLPIGTRSKEFYLSYGISESRMFLTPYSVDNDFFVDRGMPLLARKSEVRRELAIPQEMPVILYAGKLMERKRPMDLVRAFEGLGESAALVLVGDGELRSPMQDYVRRKNIANVFFAGFRNQSELPEYYAIADMFVLPSAYEPWGLVINEAMSYGLPVITTDGVAASADLIRAGENGFVYAAGDVDALQTLLKDLVSDPGKREKMGQQSRQIISTWNYDACVNGIVDALKYAAN
jgi:glycosyltransferase involved in cell wall biosynthesis